MSMEATRGAPEPGQEVFAGMRKRAVSAEVQSLEAKLAKEAAKIIKLKVNQNATNLELQEKICKLEDVRERQQRNLVELQMQYETRDGEYQNERRLREDTLNKVKRTRSICNVLEKCLEQMSETLIRCQTDRQEMIEAYQKVTQVVRDIKVKYSQDEDAFKHTVSNLKQQVTLISGSKEEMKEEWNETKKSLQVVIQELKHNIEMKDNELRDCQKTVSQVNITNNNLNNDLEQIKKDVELRDSKIQELESEMSKLNRAYSAKLGEMNLIIQGQEKQLTDNMQSLETLQTALHNQDDFVKSVNNQNTHLQDKITNLEEDKANLLCQVEKLTNHIEDMNNTLQTRENMIEVFNQDKVEIVKQNQEKDWALQQGEIELGKLKEEVAIIQKEMAEREQFYHHNQNIWSQNEKELVETIETLKSEVIAKNEAFDQTNQQVAELKIQISQLEEKNLSIRELGENREKIISELKSQIEKESKELTEHAQLITKLMSEMKSGTELRAALQMTIEKYKRELKAGEEFNRLNIEKLAQKGNEMQDMRDEIISLKIKLDVATGNANDLRKEIDSLEAIQTSQKTAEQPRSQPTEHQRPAEEDYQVILSPILSLSSKSKDSQDKIWAQPSTVAKRTNKQQGRVTFASPTGTQISYTPEPGLSENGADGFPKNNERRYESSRKMQKQPRVVRRKSKPQRHDFSDSSFDGDFSLEAENRRKELKVIQRNNASQVERAKRKHSSSNAENFLHQEKDSEPTRDVPVTTNKFFNRRNTLNNDQFKRTRTMID